MKSYLLLFILLFSLKTFSQWTQKANYGGGRREYAAGFSIDDKGYILTGNNSAGINEADFWEWDPVTDTWTRKADFPGTALSRAVGFSIGTKGYIGTGFGDTYERELWEWEQSTDTWTKKADLPSDGRFGAIGFAIGSKGYIGFGNRGSLWPYTFSEDFWEWDQATNSWSEKASNSYLATEGAVAFSIGTKGYVLNGKTLWEWDQATNVWTQKATFIGHGRIYAVSFSINSKGYVGTGDTAGEYYGHSKSFWEYDPGTDIWTKKEDFETGRGAAVGFSIGYKGYIGTGRDADSLRSDFWEYSPPSSDITSPDIYNELIKISPNPTFSLISIDSPEKSLIEIYNINGKVIETYNPSTKIFSIDLSNYLSGIYFIKIKNDQHTVTKKIIKL